MNNGGGVDGPPPPPPGTGEYLLQLLRRSTPPTHPPFAPHAFFNRYPTNPIPKSETIQTSGTYLNNTSVGEGNINNTTLLSHPPLSLSSNLNHKNSPNRPTLNGNGYEPNYYRNSTDLYGVVGGYNVALNGYETNYQNLPNLNQDFRNLSLNGYETNYQNSQNYNRVGVGYSRASNGYEANYQNSPSLGRGGYNRALNRYQADYRNNRALNRFQNSPNSSRIDEGNSRVSNRSDFHFEKNISRYSKYQGTTSKVVKQPPQGTGKRKSNKNLGQNINKEKGNLNGSRERSVKDKDEREKGGVIGERRLDTQIDSPGLPVENYPSSVSVVEAVEVVEESVSELQSEIGENGENQREFGDDLGDVDGKMSGSLESGKKNRSKNYRLDTRGQTVISQKKRKSSRQLQCRSDVDMLTAPLLAIYDSLIPQEEEKMKQKQLLSLLESIVIKEWPEARLFVYGSCANSFGVRNSDIDICLTIKDVDVLDKSEILWRLADILNEERFKNVQALTHARVPIVKLMDSTTGISCDICVNNVLAVVNSKLLRDYAKIDDRLRQLAYIVKHWAKSRGVNETYHGTLSSYAYVLMCIHFLQQRRPAILPCLQEMDSTYSVVVDNVECSFFDQIEKLSGFGSRNRDNIGQLVWGFFRYWAFCHDYVHDVISVRVGSTISKRDKEWNTRIGRDRHLICIEDPFEISHDLGRVVDKRSIKVLREEFERAAEILQFDPNPCVTLFEPYVPN